MIHFENIYFKLIFYWFLFRRIQRIEIIVKIISIPLKINAMIAAINSRTILILRTHIGLEPQEINLQCNQYNCHY